MTGLKTKIQETLRTMSNNAQQTGGSMYASEGAASSFSTVTNRGKSGPRRRKRWRSRHPLRELRLDKGFTLEELAELTSLSPSYLSRLESGSRRLNADIMQKLAEVLECHPGELLPNTSSDTTFSASTAANQSMAAAQTTATQDLPLYHIATTPEGVHKIDFAHPTEWMGRPAELAEAKKAFSISMPTNAMFPRYQAGERLIAHPTKALTKNCFVIVTTKDNNLIVGQFDGWQSSESNEASFGPIEANENDKLIITQLGDEMSKLPDADINAKTFNIMRKNISSISRIVGCMDAA